MIVPTKWVMVIMSMMIMKCGSKPTQFCFFAYQSFSHSSRWFDVYDPESFQFYAFLNLLHYIGS